MSYLWFSKTYFYIAYFQAILQQNLRILKCLSINLRYEQYDGKLFDKQW